MKKFFLIGVISLSLMGCDRHDQTSPTPPKENDSTAMTRHPGDQSETEADRIITQKIRRAIIADEALSPQAKNIKIITIKGVVTLRGPVLTPKERDAILRRIHELGGIERVENQLEILQNR